MLDSEDNEEDLRDFETDTYAEEVRDPVSFVLRRTGL